VAADSGCLPAFFRNYLDVEATRNCAPLNANPERMLRRLDRHQNIQAGQPVAPLKRETCIACGRRVPVAVGSIVGQSQ
jgi:hypothetical protein